MVALRRGDGRGGEGRWQGRVRQVKGRGVNGGRGERRGRVR